MKYIINALSVSGIKCIDKSICLNFTGKYLLKNTKLIDIKESNVKAIYGPNGAGKSAIINALWIYKNLIKNPLFLTSSKNQLLLNALVNKSLRELNLCVVFTCVDEQNSLMTFKHCICLKDSKAKPGIYSIFHESIDLLTGTYIKEELFKNLITINENVFNTSLKSADEIRKINDTTANLLSNRSLVNILTERPINPLNEVQTAVNKINDFFSNVIINISNDDSHELDIDSVFLKESINSFKAEETNDIFKAMMNNFDTDNIYLTSDMEKANKEEEKAKTKFIQIFEPTVKEIKLKKMSSVGNVGIYKEFIEYSGYEIAYKYESTGIRKLLNLFPVLNSISKGKIGFVDEFDAGINDVLFGKMVEYFSAYGEGQLCFTTHNIEPLEILCNKKHGLDFLNGSKITSWANNGNYSAFQKYRNGLIENMPFNVTPEAFMSVFGEDVK